MDSLNKAIRRTMLKLGSAAALTDGQLLARFVSSQDQPAFEELVRRHGPMVLRVCRRVLCHAQDAEDAFQATFIVLTHKAQAVVKQESVASWLHGVAYRVALKARAGASQRHARETAGAAALLADNPPGDPTGQDLRLVLDEELKRLPEKYQTPIILCYLEGKTVEEAARQLGCQASAVKMRLLRARERLHGRLTRRGVTLSAGAMATLLAQDTATAALPDSLARAVVEAAKLAAAGQPGALSPSAVALADAALRTMTANKLKLAAAILCAALLIGGLAVGIASLATKLPPTAPKGWQLRTTLEQPGPIHSMAFYPDGKTLAVASVNGFVKLWDVTTCEARSAIGRGSVTISPDGATLVAWSQEADRLKPTRSWTVTVTFLAGSKVSSTMHMSHSWLVTPSPDGRILAEAYRDHTIKFFDTATDKETRHFPGHTDAISCLAFSPDGKTLAAGSKAGGVKVWDVATAREQASFPGHTDEVYFAAFSPDSKRLATLGKDGTVKVWDVATAKERASFPGAAGAALSPDGSTLAAGAVDGTCVRVWDVAAGKELGTLPGPSDMSHLVFSPDGKILAWGTHRHGVQLWAAGP